MKTTFNPIEVGYNYIEKGYSVVPDKYKDKACFLKGWNLYAKRVPPPSELDKWCKKKHNIAVMLGAVSGVVVVDFDKIRDDYHSRILKLLFPTPVIKGSPNGYSLFYRYNGEKSNAWGVREIQKNGKMGLTVVAEVLSTGNKTTVAPSIHPCGEPYTWVGKKTLLEVSPSQLPCLPSNFYESLDKMFNVKSRSRRIPYV